jgi:hypothetical protein
MAEGAAASRSYHFAPPSCMVSMLDELPRLAG